MLEITNGKGFQLTFANGYTVSIQFGYGNYCENQSVDSRSPSQRCRNAEIACWGGTGDYLSCGNDIVRGWVSANHVAAFIAWAAAIDPANPPTEVPDFKDPAPKPDPSDWGGAHVSDGNWKGRVT